MIKLIKNLLNNDAQVIVQPGTTVTKQLPYVQPNQNLPLINQNQVQPVPAQQTPEANAQVLQQAGTMATQGVDPTIQNALNQKTLELLNQKAPDYTQEKTTQMEKFNLDQSKALQALTQQYADVANLGPSLQKMVEVQLQTPVLRSQLETQIDAQQRQEELDRQMKILAEGRSTAESERNRFATNIGALTSVAGAYEPGLQRSYEASQNAINRGLEIAKLNQNATLQTSLTELQGKIQQGLQLGAQDFESVQNELNRQLQESMQKNDIEATKSNLQTQLETNRAMQQAGFNQDLTLQERTQIFESAQNDMNRQLQLSIQSNDIEATRTNIMTQLQNQKEMQSAGFTFEAAMQNKQMDHETIQNELQRQLQQSLAEGNWDNAMQIETLRQSYEVQRQQADQEFSKQERVADQAWKTSERLSAEDYSKAMQTIQYNQQVALQNNDFSQQRIMQDLQSKLQLQLQTADFDQQEKMTYLNSQLAEARANNDVSRQQTILEFQHGQQMELIKEQQGFEQAMQYNEQQLQLSLQKNDQVAAKALQMDRLNMEASERAKDRVLQEAQIALSQKGLDMQALQQQYEQIADQEARGIVEAGASTKFLQDQLNKNGVTGVTLKSINADDQMKKAIDAQYNSMMYQYAITHKEFQDTTKASGLSDDGMKAFTDWYNEQTYGKTGNSVDDLMNNISGTITDEAKLQKVYDSAKEWTMTQHVDGRGFWNPDCGVIDNPPAQGTVIKFAGDNNPYQVLTGIAEETSGENYQYFTVKNLSTGEVKTVQASNGDDNITKWWEHI